ncbi:MAG: NAD(P)H nitroreductase [Vibrio sp.]|uniref:NAD(P)H nitroreductase n=1 Tax=Vibrio sp. TaxID=678 RepID=UPI003A856D64
MDALELLLNRRSMAKLEAPAPEGKALENIIRAGLRAPDHANLTPWRFVIAQGSGLHKLSDILVKAATAGNNDEASVAKMKDAPFRAPMVITVIAKVTPHDKVPAFEQHLSAGCALQAMQMAAVAQGFQGIWRSGNLMFHSEVRNAFGLEGEDQVVGFLYLGTPEGTTMKVPERELSKFVEFL